LREVFSLAWSRFSLIASIFGEVQGYIISTLFYFTILIPFGIGSRLASDPLKIRSSFTDSKWLDRQPIPDDLDSARQQG
jgi:hypothetical protein